MTKTFLEAKFLTQISASLAQANVQNWHTYDSSGITNVEYPLIAVVTNPDGETLYKENIAGLYRLNVAVVCQADKTVTEYEDFNRISGIVFDDLLLNGLPSDSNIKIHDFYETTPATVESADDGWTASNTFSVVVQKLQKEI